MKLIMKKILYLVAFIFYPFIFLLDFIVPVKKGRILFYSKGGRFYDNPRYLYEYILKNKIGWHPVWISKEMDDYRMIKEKYGSQYVLLACGLKGYLKIFLLYLTSSVVIIRGKADIWLVRRFMSRKNRIIINLGHGIPLKKVGILTPRNQSISKAEIMMRRSVDYYIVTSEIERYVRSACFYVHAKSFAVTGFPRNDAMYKRLNKEKEIRAELKQLLKTDIYFSKVLLYAPTHRDEEGAARFFPFSDYKEKELNDFLEENELLVLLRTHSDENAFGRNKDSAGNNVQNNPRIFCVPHSILMDVNEILPGVDVLLTDYSSIYFDYLLCDKPVVFIPYDLHEYKQYRGLLFNYDLAAPGAKVYTQAEFFKEVRGCLKDPSRHYKKREYVRNVFHKYQDAGSAGRIIELIENKIG